MSLKKCLFACLLASGLLTSAFSYETFVSIPSSLENSVRSLYAFPETRPLFSAMQKEGAILLKWEKLGKHMSPALWIGGKKRTIILNASMSLNEGQKISYILMEMHNAESNGELNSLDYKVRHHQFSKRDYVVAVEKMEHKNALKTSLLIERGISRGYFPSSARYSIYFDFQKHLQLQMDSGHTTYLAKRYDTIVTQIFA